MTQAQVIAIMGKPWDDSLLDPEPPAWYGLNGAFDKLDYYKFTRPTYWYGETFMVGAVFDGRGVLIDKAGEWISPVADFRAPFRSDPRTSLPERIWWRLATRWGW